MDVNSTTESLSRKMARHKKIVNLIYIHNANPQRNRLMSFVLKIVK